MTYQQRRTGLCAAVSALESFEALLRRVHNAGEAGYVPASREEQDGLFDALSGGHFAGAAVRTDPQGERFWLTLAGMSVIEDRGGGADRDLAAALSVVQHGSRR